MRKAADVAATTAKDDGEERRREMLDFTEGWTWFLAGLGVTFFAAVIFLAVLGIAWWCDEDRRSPHSA
jgi:hypothetical protein